MPAQNEELGRAVAVFLPHWGAHHGREERGVAFQHTDIALEVAAGGVEGWGLVGFSRISAGDLAANEGLRGAVVVGHHLHAVLAPSGRPAAGRPGQQLAVSPPAPRARNPSAADP